MGDIPINIPKALFEDIERFCMFNGKDVEKYCVSCLRKQLAVDKYGDLNDKVETPKKVEPNPVIEEPKNETTVTEEPKPVEMQKESAKTTETFSEETKVKETDTENEEKQVKKHRTIKSR